MRPIFHNFTQTPSVLQKNYLNPEIQMDYKTPRSFVSVNSSSFSSSSRPLKQALQHAFGVYNYMVGAFVRQLYLALSSGSNGEHEAAAVFLKRIFDLVLR